MQAARQIRSEAHRATMPLGIIFAVAALTLGAGTALQATAADRAVAFEIVAPSEGSTVSSPVQLQLNISGAEIGRPSDGLDHVHVAVDDGQAKSIYEAGVISLDLPPGEHTVMVEVAGPNHHALLPAKHVSFTVK